MNRLGRKANGTLLLFLIGCVTIGGLVTTIITSWQVDVSTSSATCATLLPLPYDCRAEESLVAEIISLKNRTLLLQEYTFEVRLDMNDVAPPITAFDNAFRTQWEWTRDEIVVAEIILLKNRTLLLQEYTFEVRLDINDVDPPITAFDHAFRTQWEWTRDEIVVSKPDNGVVLVLEDQCQLAAACVLSVGPQCEACVPGYFRHNASGLCDPCPENAFKPEYGNQSCSPCAVPLTTLGFTGQSACWGCANGVCETCALGFALPTCRACAPGSVGTQAKECIECEAGTFATGQALTTCTACHTGTFASGKGSTTCEECGPFSVAPQPGMAHCECVPGSTLDHGGTRCVPCQPGQYMLVDQCLPCPAGTHCKEEGCALRCQECEYAPWEGASACSVCVGQNVSSTACLCPDGFFSTDGSSKITSLTQCQACTTVCATASFVTAECTPVQDTQFQACKARCDVDGFFVVEECTSTTDIVCKRCSTQCLRGGYMVQECTRNRNMMCAPCTLSCPEGSVPVKACDMMHNLECMACPAGTFSNGTCQTCPEGTIAATEGSRACEPCADSMTNVQQTQCYAQCPPGSYPLTFSVCALCPPMTYGPTGHGCVSCVGKHFYTWGATAC